MWRLAESLKKLLDQLNDLHPNRSKASDGGIGDAAHQAQGSASDHNPWIKDGHGVGVVTAFDFTHDPKNGMNIDKLSDVLTASRDSRIKYMIANGKILIPKKLPWANDFGWHWQEYIGDPHTSHLHVSVTGEFDSNKEWELGDEMYEARFENKTQKKSAKGWFGRALHYRKRVLEVLKLVAKLQKEIADLSKEETAKRLEDIKKIVNGEK